MSSLINFRENIKFSDVIIYCRNSKFNFSRFVLGHSSDVFGDILNNCKTGFKVDDIEDDFNILLNIMYGNNCIDENNYYGVYVLLEKYKICVGKDYIIDKCINEYKLSCQSIEIIQQCGDKKMDYLCKRYVNYEEIDGLEQVSDYFWLGCAKYYNDVTVDVYDRILKYVECEDIKKNIINMING
jgi:hypothetical protein